jgi:hypothetical protein
LPACEIYLRKKQRKTPLFLRKMAYSINKVMTRKKEKVMTYEEARKKERDKTHNMYSALWRIMARSASKKLFHHDKINFQELRDWWLDALGYECEIINGHFAFKSEVDEIHARLRW